MYDRKPGDQVLTFTVSGKLWNRSLVMRDPETGSLWSHLLGRAMAGPLEGTELEMLPSVITDWESWKAQEPDTTVLALSRTAKEFTRDFQAQPQRFVLGVRAGAAVKAYPFTALQHQPVLNDRVGDEPVVITFDPTTGAARVFSRQRDGETLAFSAAGDGRMVDGDGTSWDAVTGRGPGGQQLEPLIGIPSFGRAWKVFHPDSAVYTGGN